jgi:hypothetical protein
MSGILGQADPLLPCRSADTVRFLRFEHMSDYCRAQAGCESQLAGQVRGLAFRHLLVSFGFLTKPK